MIARLLAALVVIAAPWAALAQSGQSDLAALAAKAKGQSFAVVTATEESYGLVLAEFAKTFDIELETTAMRPSSAIARIRTEQKNDRFGWDIWMGGTSNMVNSASPGGLLDPIEPYFLLPEVKQASNWRHPDFIFGDDAKRVFTFSNRLEFFMLRNTAVVPEVKVETWTDLLDPRLKGKISMRDASVPNAGTFVLATLYGNAGGDVLRKLLKDQDVKVYENPQQLQQAITRGGQAVSIGLETFLWDKCRADGGCKEIDQLLQFGSSISTGFSIPKNPPHPDVVKLFVNWFLSKEGQEVWVKT
jgi:ABC-type Fe3+ transport system substrate-binding protein